MSKAFLSFPLVFINFKLFDKILQLLYILHIKLFLLTIFKQLHAGRQTDRRMDQTTTTGSTHLTNYVRTYYYYY